MKKVIFIVLFYLCQHGCDSAQLSQRKHDSAPIRTLVKLTYRTKRHTEGEPWLFSIPFPGMTANLKLFKTEGCLINSNVSAWAAFGNDDSVGIKYTRIPKKIMEKLGKMDFYHDIEQNAAVVVFHEQDRIDGYVGFRRFLLETDDFGGNDDDDGHARRYWLTEQNESFSTRNSDSLMEEKTKPESAEDEVPRDHPATFVYPQLLIQLAHEDVKKGLMDGIRKMIVYYNAVDMLYRKLEKPQIRINMAGLIIPMNKYTTPWFQRNTYRDSGYVASQRALAHLGLHFENLTTIFPDDHFDFMISFGANPLGPDGESLGIAFPNIGCAQKQRHNRVSILKNNMQEYPTGAHEFAHLLSAEHDGKFPRCKDLRGIMASRAVSDVPSAFQWSSCAQESLQNYFSKRKSECLDNCPSTKPNCTRSQASKPVVPGVPEQVTQHIPQLVTETVTERVHVDITEVPTSKPIEIPQQVTQHIPQLVTETTTEQVHVDVPMDPYCFPRFYKPVERCQKTVWPEFDQDIRCETGIECYSKYDITNDCSSRKSTPQELATCTKLYNTAVLANQNLPRNYTIPAIDGTICEWDNSGPIGACYGGKCSEINEEKPNCVLWEESKR